LTLLMTRTLSDISDLTLANRSHRIPTRVRSGRDSFPYRSLTSKNHSGGPDCAARRDTHNILTDTSPDLSLALSMVCGPAPHPVGTCSAHSPQAILEGKVVTPKSRRRFGPERGEDIAWLRGFASSSGDFVGYSVLLDVTAVPATFDVWKFLPSGSAEHADWSAGALEWKRR